MAVLTVYFYFSNIELLTIIKAFLVFWFGWGTCDFSVYKYTSKEYRLLATPDLLELEKNKEVLEKKESELSTKACTLSAETKKLENKLRNIEVVETFYNSIEENKFKLKKEKNIIKCDHMLNTFLNERIDYANIELEVSYYNEDKYKNHNKILKKTRNNS